MKLNTEELKEKIVNEEIKFYEVEGYVDGDINKATVLRRKALEKMTGASLETIGNYSFDMAQTAMRNIENPIGAAQIPIGVAGPLKVKGDYADGKYYLPLCTTEGALVASVNRGASIITDSGGAKSKIFRSLMVRAPVMKVPDAEHAVKLVEWVEEHFEEVKAAFKGDEPFVWLHDFQWWILGRNVFKISGRFC